MPSVRQVSVFTENRIGALSDLLGVFDTASAADDGPESMAAAILELLGDQQEAQRRGANARVAAERHYDWRVIGARLADEVLARIG